MAKGPDGAIAAANFSLRPDREGETRSPLLGAESVTLALPRNIPIEGRLLSPAGQPVAGARVELLQLRTQEWHEQP